MIIRCARDNPETLISKAEYLSTSVKYFFPLKLFTYTRDDGVNSIESNNNLKATTFLSKNF